MLWLAQRQLYKSRATLSIEQSDVKQLRIATEPLPFAAF